MGILVGKNILDNILFVAHSQRIIANDLSLNLTPAFPNWYMYTVQAKAVVILILGPNRGSISTIIHIHMQYITVYVQYIQC